MSLLLQICNPDHTEMGRRSVLPNLQRLVLNKSGQFLLCPSDRGSLRYTVGMGKPALPACQEGEEGGREGGGTELVLARLTWMEVQGAFNAKSAVGPGAGIHPGVGRGRGRASAAMRTKNPQSQRSPL